jgi:3',5'-cyclic AMP phosphodiesterase CpdA
MRNIILIVTIILVTGCATNFKPYDDPPDKWLTHDIAIISDTQIHENKGESSRYLGKAADKAVSVTLRPAQQTIGAPEVLRKVLHDIPPDYRILHMGDALDISCVSEWEQFIDIMSSANREWIFIPGNHDGYFVGNFHPFSIDDRYNQILKKSQWDQLCNRGRYYNIDPPPPRSLDKNSLIKSYLISLSERYSNDKISPGKSKARIIINENRFLKCISWKIDETKPWRSYILQMVNLPSLNNSNSGYYALLPDFRQNDRNRIRDAAVSRSVLGLQLRRYFSDRYCEKCSTPGRSPAALA